MDDFLDIIQNESVFEDLTLSHTKFQLENFVLGQEQAVTVWGKYKQVLRELHSRMVGLKEIRYQIKKKQIDIKRLERKLQVTDDDLDIEEIHIDLENEQFNLKILRNQEADKIREGNILSGAYVKIKRIVDEELSHGKTKDQLEEEYWINKLKEDLQNSVLSLKGASIGLIRTIRGMKDESKIIEILDEYYKAHWQDNMDARVIDFE